MKHRFAAQLWVGALVLLLGACGTSSQGAATPTPTSNPALAQGYSDQTLATGKVATLPTGPLYNQRDRCAASRW